MNNMVVSIIHACILFIVVLLTISLWPIILSFWRCCTANLSQINHIERAHVRFILFLICLHCHQQQIILNNESIFEFNYGTEHEWMWQVFGKLFEKKVLFPATNWFFDDLFFPKPNHCTPPPPLQQITNVFLSKKRHRRKLWSKHSWLLLEMYGLFQYFLLSVCCAGKAKGTTWVVSCVFI